MEISVHTCTSGGFYDKNIRIILMKWQKKVPFPSYQRIKKVLNKIKDVDVLQSTQNQVHVYDPSHVYKTLPPKSPVRESQKNRVTMVKTCNTNHKNIVPFQSWTWIILHALHKFKLNKQTKSGQGVFLVMHVLHIIN